MIQEINFPTQLTYYIILNGSEIIDYGFITSDRCLSTSQPTLETFTDESLYNQRLTQLGIDINPTGDSSSEISTLEL
jgi:hypothetical protein